MRGLPGTSGRCRRDDPGATAEKPVSLYRDFKSKLDANLPAESNIEK